MKPYPYRMIFLVLVMALSLVACGGTSSATQPPGTAAGPGAGAGALPTATRLAVAMFRLEETSAPISAEQAKELLPLWKALLVLGDSETTAAEELQAVVRQIEAGLTAEQVAAVEAMNLGPQDIRALAQQLGLELGGGMGASMRATAEASGQGRSGGFGGGMPGGGMPGGGPEGGFSPQAMQTAQAARGSLGNSGAGVNQALLEAVIEFLKSK